MTEKLILQALHGQRPPRLPIWMMRQAGRYLPEYRATRAKAGDFLSLCYTPDLAAEVTLQPIRRFGFDGAILFADILLIAQALGPKLWFAEGEGPRLSPVQSAADVAALRPSEDVHETLAPVYETLRILRRALPAETTLIGFAGAPWTVASYMIAGRGVPGQGPAHAFKAADRTAFTTLIDRLTEASIEYLSAQAEAGAEVLKIFDSWAGSLQGTDFDDFAVKPTARIIAALKARHPNVPVIAFPRGAGLRYEGFAEATGAAGLALDQEVSAEWAARVLQPKVCVQGNLAPELLVQGGPALVTETRRIAETLKGGPHIFNLGHGITPEAPIAHVETMIETLRAWEQGA